MSQVTEKTVQAILNSNCDDTGRLAVGIASWTGSSWVASSTTYSVKITVSGSITYVAKAAPGSSQASAVWQCQKIDETTGTVITWADGNAKFDNVATNLQSLSYS